MKRTRTLVQPTPIRLARVASARCSPGSWWWSKRGNLRVRCPLCTEPYRLNVRPSDIDRHGRMPWPIVHYRHGCSDHCAWLRLGDWNALADIGRDGR